VLDVVEPVVTVVDAVVSDAVVVANVVVAIVVVGEVEVSLDIPLSVHPLPREVTVQEVKERERED